MTPHTLDRAQEAYTRHIQETRRFAVLAMRAARNGLDSLSSAEKYDLMCWVGFDIEDFWAVTEKERDGS